MYVPRLGVYDVAPVVADVVVNKGHAMHGLFPPTALYVPRGQGRHGVEDIIDVNRVALWMNAGPNRDTL